jgi:hypothetical protein
MTHRKRFMFGRAAMNLLRVVGVGGLDGRCRLDHRRCCGRSHSVDREVVRALNWKRSKTPPHFRNDDLQKPPRVIAAGRMIWSAQKAKESPADQ